MARSERNAGTCMNTLGWFRLLSCLILSTAALPQAQPPTASPSVTIAAGTLIGKQSRIPNRPDITEVGNAYLGIPFAQSPPERFSPPVAAPKWQSPLMAQALKPACIQQFPGPKAAQDALKEYFNNPTGPPPEESEDCLYLNVFTPSTPSNATTDIKRPVMFWIYGGNLLLGTGGLRFYEGTSLAVSQNVVVVTINYRTNIFGFSNSPDIPRGSQNVGFLDQRMALRWVHDNIAAFGGDPERVLIFGESAGGESVRQLLANPPEPQQFHAAIMESPGIAMFGNGLSNYKRVLRHFTCKDIACLRKVPAANITTYIQDNILFFPPVDGDGTNVASTKAKIASGSFAKVPVMIGSNKNEIGVFAAILRRALGEKGPQQGNEGDAGWGCTVAKQAKLLVSKGYDVWRYRFDVGLPESELFSGLGATHTAEIPAVFGTYPFEPHNNVTQRYAKFSEYIQSVWAGFAANPSQGPGWANVGGGDSSSVGVLGYQNGTGMTVMSAVTIDSTCGGFLGGAAGLLGIPFVPRHKML